MFINPHAEWYSIHVPAGLPERIARAANARNMTPGEFIAQAVSQSLSRGATGPPHRVRASDLTHESKPVECARV